MEKQALIDMLNRDIADEHAAIIRYLVHGYMEGEDTPLGASLISITREEMWHMHWLGMIIGKLGGEPNFTPAPYPYDPTSRATMLRSYIEYEEKLIPHYNEEVNKIDDLHIRRVLQREAWESAIHARKFQRKLDKLSPEEAAGLPGEESELPKELLDKLQAEQPSGDVAVDIDTVKPLLIELAGLLESDLMEAMSRLDVLKVHFENSVVREEFKRLEKHIDGFDTDSAIKSLGEIAKTLTISLKEG